MKPSLTAKAGKIDFKSPALLTQKKGQKLNSLKGLHRRCQTAAVLQAINHVHH